MAFIENIPQNVKKYHDMCEEMFCCFFLMIVATANSGMPTPKICFLPGQLKRTILT